MPRKGMWAQIGASTRKYLVTKTVMSVITGALTALILTILGLDMAPMFGLLAFLLNYIPTLGSLVALILPIPVALIQFDSTLLIVLSVLLPGAVQMLVGGIMEPKLMGETLDLHPVTILLALMFWGLLWGPIGALLATPICVIVKSVLLRFEASHDFGELMAGRLPSLETLES
jgi:AI-2 transport protein TqsA